MSDFNKDGYEILEKFFNKEEFSSIYNYVLNHINKKIQGLYKDKNIPFLKDVKNYHNYIEEFNLDHELIVSTKNRYFYPSDSLNSILRKDALISFIKNISGFFDFDMCADPGLSWLGFRLIRPLKNDGYPPSCKNWGNSKNVYSIWIPLAGSTVKSNIRFLKGSHKKTYKSYLPKNSKFIDGEYRLNEDISVNKFVRPSLDYGDLIVFHPNCIHSEDSNDEKETRLNLEYRFLPKK
tara:strand:+ start:13986 stop:14693 length:708 start_codon:yes stop_codon:yes gene_type:complete